MNRFEGHIPASLGNATGITEMGLSSNSFTGKIPISSGKLSGLTFLNLEENHLVARDDKDWEFLDAFANCSSLERFSLASNNLQGSLPASIGNLSTSLEHLLLGGNSLSGQIPHRIGKLSALS
jgi:Leucine-rich repeat (LRR) protein